MHELAEILEDYLLARDLAPDSDAFYRRTVAVYSNWNGHQPFSANSVSQFLRDKQAEGRSSHYRKSLRNGLCALLGHAKIAGKVRTVKLDRLEPEVWSPAEVSRLIAAAPDEWWKTIIAFCYYTGLQQCDCVNRFRRSWIAADGMVKTTRKKTGKLVVAMIPKRLADELRNGADPIWPWPQSKEWFRRSFKEIAKQAGLKGTFKKLRKSSGTASELLHPGRGHEHLANSRTIFERHYLSPTAWQISPLSPPELP
jgi:integrase